MWNGQCRKSPHKGTIAKCGGSFHLATFLSKREQLKEYIVKPIM